jgi:hypothetical protein
LNFFIQQGLSFTRDDKDLYTNRAQAFIKLEKYKEAISDCDWALRVSKISEKLLLIIFNAKFFLLGR